ncbi:hypothetical protein FCI23_55355 [Actinacidiphila oryziradicis]|uniref:Uncharacterized protein n=2 Tax=Actinacidiphila oryziradicis TaxID=2571141 RepID=A0A4V6WIR8_9ACTN|nr:hypothetical protein FCI23_55355 [Actinacidiphila oryziradicis]
MAVTVAALLLTAACAERTVGGPAAGVTAPPPDAATPSTRPSVMDSEASGRIQQQLDPAANAIEHLGASYPGSYTGQSVDIPGDRIIVYRKKDPAFDAALATLHTGVPAMLRDAPRTRAELFATQSQVATLVGHTTGYKIWTVGSGSDATWSRGVVEVQITGDLARAKRELAAKFGDRVQVTIGEPPVG